MAARNFHVPLPEELYHRLEEEAGRCGSPATHLAREAIERYLEELGRQAVHEAIVEYATRAAGTKDDLDPDLVSAAEEHLETIE